MVVTVYSTPTCPYCKMTKDFLKRHNVNFKNVDVSTDRKAAELMIRKSGQMGVPVIESGKKIIIGFNVSELTAALKDQIGAKKKAPKKKVVRKKVAKKKVSKKKAPKKKVVRKKAASKKKATRKKATKKKHSKKKVAKRKPSKKKTTKKRRR